MSLTPYLSIAIRSIPKPNANPEYFFVSIEQFLSTFGFTMPQPRISSHLSPKSISTSAEGSVNGKNDGLKRNLILSPNSEKHILYIRSLR